MLCSVCHRQLDRGRARCRACGTPRDGAVHLDLVLATGQRVPLDRPLQLGRSPACELRLSDPSVSRLHAEIRIDASGPVLQDAGSSYGTFVDGREIQAPTRLLDGMQIDLGDSRLTVAQRRDAAAAGMTMSVPVGISLVVPALDPTVVPHGSARSPSPPAVARPASPRAAARRARLRGQGRSRPRLRGGWSLKRLDADEGELRWVLKDHRAAEFLRLGDAEAGLIELLDGEHELIELVGAAGARCGPEGPARLARLLAELADRGMLAGVEAAPEAAPSAWARLMRPREREIPGAARAIAALYRRGGWRIFTRPVLALLAAVALAGLLAFAALLIGGNLTPLVVARRVGIGALVFVIGRLALVVCHELGHGLLAESFGRPVARAGLKVALVFPYVFVDTSDAWFESRHRRLMISLAGPASDLTLGGAFSLACWLISPGSLRDVLFQVALGGYVGALFNLNPLMERDGYHALVDLLGQPGLRRRSAVALQRRLRGGAAAAAERPLILYGAASLAWTAAMAGFAVLVSLRYYDRLARLAPPALVWTVLAAFYLVLVLPLGLGLLRPLVARVLRPAVT
jgi:putative peptide zinc metalloprotease protein